MWTWKKTKSLPWLEYDLSFNIHVNLLTDYLVYVVGKIADLMCQCNQLAFTLYCKILPCLALERIKSLSSKEVKLVLIKPSSNSFWFFQSDLCLPNCIDHHNPAPLCHLLSVACILPLYFFTLGLGGARQFPGIVRKSVQGFQPHVFVLRPHTCMWGACFYVLDGTILWAQDNSTRFSIFLNILL